MELTNLDLIMWNEEELALEKELLEKSDRNLIEFHIQFEGKKQVL